MTQETIQSRKKSLREDCKSRLRALEDVETPSRGIYGRLMEMSEYRAASTVCTFLSLPNEVQTLPLVRSAWDDGKEVVVPCCLGSRLELFHLKSMEELAPRTLGILEPRDELRNRAERWVDPGRVGLFIVPGLAFDASGGRLGHGKGYYDRLLADVSARVPKIALAFEAQMVEAVPMTRDDVFVDCVVTERRVHWRERQ